MAKAVEMKLHISQDGLPSYIVCSFKKKMRLEKLVVDPSGAELLINSVEEGKGRKEKIKKITVSSAHRRPLWGRRLDDAGRIGEEPSKFKWLPFVLLH